MAYTRGDCYIWRTDRHVHLWVRRAEDDVSAWVEGCGFAAGVAIPIEVFDQVVMMRYAQLTASEREAATARAMAQHPNAGCAALFEQEGVTPPWARE
jgi:hypothetical protein